MDQKNPVLGEVALELSLLCSEKSDLLYTVTEAHLSPRVDWMWTGAPEPHHIPLPTPSDSSHWRGSPVIT